MTRGGLTTHPGSTIVIALTTIASIGVEYRAKNQEFPNLRQISCCEGAPTYRFGRRDLWSKVRRLSGGDEDLVRLARCCPESTGDHGRRLKSRKVDPPLHAISAQKVGRP